MPNCRFTCHCTACIEELGSKTSDYIERYNELKQRSESLYSVDDIVNIHLEINGILKNNRCKIIWRIRNLEEALALKPNIIQENLIIKELEKLKIFTTFFL